MYYRLSSAQRTFDTEMFTGNTPVWNNVLYVLFDGKIAYDEFSNILNEIFEENSMLRTSFYKDDDGQLMQKINNYHPQEFECLLFDSKDELDDFAKREADAPTLICENPLKFYIVKLDDKIGCLVRIHHILFDGFCVSLFIEKLKSKLNLIENKNIIYPYEKIFTDEESYIGSNRYIRSVKFWNKKLEKSFSNSIFDFASSDDYSATELWFDFDKEKISLAKEICKNNNIPFSAFLYSVFAVYVNKTIGLTDFSIGMPMINRMSNEDMHTLGLYMHILPLIINIEEDASFLTVLECVYDGILELSKHQKFTQYDIKNNCNCKDILQLYDVSVNYNPITFMPECEFNSFRSSFATTPLDLRFHELEDSNIRFQVLYRNAFFQQKDIEKLFDQLKRIVDAFVENSNELIKDVSLNSNHRISSAELEILNSFNNTNHQYSIEQSSTIYILFENTAKKNANEICLLADEKRITFGELLHISKILDCAIRNKVDDKSIVAVIADRSIEMYAAIYGIIRGGNAYLPIDPTYPKDRIDYIIENSGAELVVAQGKYAHLAGKTACIDMTDFLEKIPTFDEVPPCNATEDDTAYVIYTSGSTGMPKGARISHKSAVNRIAWMHDFYPLEKYDAILQKTPYTFDVSVWELFWWGMFGGKLVASKPNEHFIPEMILEEVANNKVTHIHFVPSVFDLFLSYIEKHKDEAEKFNSVKHVFLSGEALTSNLIKRFYKLYDYENVKLHNLYGPTECAVDVTYYDCNPNDVDPVPIGKPIYNTQLYVLDENIIPLPIGVTGELYIAGVNVGQGYLNNEKLTNERFIDNPFGEGKLYKTGDLAYWREDGNIIYVGRNDFQVKVRGLRIELGEIENAINGIDGITNSVVVVKRNPDRLIAFFTGNEIKENQIRKILKSKLPMYMLPNSFAHIDEMPLTSSGKIDRNKLLSIDIESTQNIISNDLLPKTELEKYVCSLYNDILSVQNVNLESDFYELGGTSLDVVKLLSDVKFSNVKIADFISNPTPNGLINLVQNASVDYKYLEALYLPNHSSKALVLFPFAGGNATGYLSLVNEFKKDNSDISLYFVDWCKDESDYIKIANEIESLSKQIEIDFYSHCAGSAIALKLLDSLPQYCINKYIAGASLPEKSLLPFSIWSLFSNNAITKYLSSAGFKRELIDDLVLEKMISQFRINTNEYQSYFNSKLTKTNVPVISVVSKSDPFTKKYKKADVIWGRLVCNHTNTIFINSKSHYFQSDNSAELYKIIINCLKEDV